MAEETKEEPPIVIKKIVKGGGHHGGAWKVAYADFVTAMMAFFLLLWLLNVSTDEQLNAISNYFDPTFPTVSSAESGAGGVLGGLSMAPEGAMATKQAPLTNPQVTGSSGLTKDNSQKNNQDTHSDGKAQNSTPQKSAVEQAKEELRQMEEERFEEVKQAIEEAIQESPELAELAKNLIIDMTPEGLRIQIVDQDGEPMFASGSARMFEKTKSLMMKVAEIVQATPNSISVRGHTDGVPYGPGADYTNWELSTDRANSSRRVLLEGGVPEERVSDVVGKADMEHLFPEDPTDPRNRRISIILLKEELTDPDYEKKAEAFAEENGYMPEEGEAPAPAKPIQVPIGTFRKTPGDVQFP